MKATDFKNQYFKENPDQKEILKRDIGFQIGRMITHARIIAGMTQEELAKAMRTKQPSVARAESGSNLPSLAFLVKMGKALDTYLLTPKFASVANLLTDDFSSKIVYKSNHTIISKFPNHYPAPSHVFLENTTTENNIVKQEFSSIVFS